MSSGSSVKKVYGPLRVPFGLYVALANFLLLMAVKAGAIAVRDVVGYQFVLLALLCACVPRLITSFTQDGWRRCITLGATGIHLSGRQRGRFVPYRNITLVQVHEKPRGHQLEFRYSRRFGSGTYKLMVDQQRMGFGAPVVAQMIEEMVKSTLNQTVGPLVFDPPAHPEQQWAVSAGTDVRLVLRRVPGPSPTGQGAAFAGAARSIVLEEREHELAIDGNEYPWTSIRRALLSTVDAGTKIALTFEFDGVDRPLTLPTDPKVDISGTDWKWTPEQLVVRVNDLARRHTTK